MNVMCLAPLLLIAATGEPQGVTRLVKATDKAVVDNALKAQGLDQRCQGALQKSDINGLRCRLVVVEAVAARPLLTEADVDVRAAIANDALAAAEYIVAAAPTAPEPGLRRARFEGHQRACSIAFGAIGAFESLATTHVGAVRARAIVAGVSTKALPAVGLRDLACACAHHSVDLGVGAEATSDELAAVQGVLTRNRCLLSGDSLRIAERKDPSRALANGNIALRAVAEASSPGGRLVEMAKGRTVEFSRCTEKNISKGKVKDKAKLTSCACGVVSRWSLPLKKDDPSVQVRLPLLEGEQLYLPITVTANAVTTCGDVEGPLLVP